jgi:single-strand selective monofunctional uracil DNA glycosylase
LLAISRRLGATAGRLRFAGDVGYVYNPLAYARAPHEQYLIRYGGGRGTTLLLGMNPGPFGMVQTGVPFGEVELTRDWLGISAPVGRPAHEHPKRPVLGYACPRSEVSGRRLWGWARDRFGQPDAFFARFFVWNYCPLAFLARSGTNLTPDKLRSGAKDELFACCDDALAALVGALRPRLVVGVGGLAAARARRVVGDAVRVGTVLHPSPANPAANRGWATAAETKLRELGALD